MLSGGSGAAKPETSGSDNLVCVKAVGFSKYYNYFTTFLSAGRIYAKMKNPSFEVKIKNWG